MTNAYALAQLDRPYTARTGHSSSTLTLFDRIRSDLPNDGFSLDDVQDYINANVDSHDESRIRQYGRKHLSSLVAMGMLEHDEESDLYSIDETSPAVARYEMGSSLEDHMYE